MTRSSTATTAAYFSVGLSAVIFVIALVASGAGSVQYHALLAIAVGLSGGIGIAVGLVTFHRAISWIPSLIFGVLMGLLLAGVAMLAVVLFYSQLTSGSIHEWVFPTALAIASFVGACLVSLLGRKDTYGNV